MTFRNTILLQGDAREEGFIAAEALTPGMLVQYDSVAGKIEQHDVEGGNVMPIMFVREQFENDGHGIADAIASGDTCTAIFPVQGARINAITEDTISGQNVPLASAGDGRVKIANLEAGEVPIGVSGGPSVAESTRLRVPLVVGAAANIVGGGVSI